MPNGKYTTWTCREQSIRKHLKGKLSIEKTSQLSDKKLFEAVKRNKLIYSGHQGKISLFSNLFSSFPILNS